MCHIHVCHVPHAGSHQGAGSSSCTWPPSFASVSTTDGVMAPSSPSPPPSPLPAHCGVPSARRPSLVGFRLAEALTLAGSQSCSRSGNPPIAQSGQPQAWGEGGSGAAPSECYISVGRPFCHVRNSTAARPGPTRKRKEPHVQQPVMSMHVTDQRAVGEFDATKGVVLMRQPSHTRGRWGPSIPGPNQRAATPTHCVR